MVGSRLGAHDIDPMHVEIASNISERRLTRKPVNERFNVFAWWPSSLPMYPSPRMTRSTRFADLRSPESSLCCAHAAGHSGIIKEREGDDVAVQCDPCLWHVDPLLRQRSWIVPMKSSS